MHNNKLVSNMNINNNIKTPEQQIDEAVAFLEHFLYRMQKIDKKRMTLVVDWILLNMN